MNPQSWINNIEPWIKILTPLGALVTFCWGVVRFLINQKSQIETRRIEATKPFLNRQLILYTEATQATATIATSNLDKETALAEKRFWSLYWGELALVEDKNVEAAMVGFGRALENQASKKELQDLSLQLAHACRNSLAESWGVKQWRKPKYHSN